MQLTNTWDTFSASGASRAAFSMRQQGALILQRSFTSCLSVRSNPFRTMGLVRGFQERGFEPDRRGNMAELLNFVQSCYMGLVLGTWT